MFYILGIVALVVIAFFVYNFLVLGKSSEDVADGIDVKMKKGYTKYYILGGFAILILLGWLTGLADKIPMNF